MNPRPPIDAKTAAAQATASDPLTSAWVAANAGSGKTFVLSRRVIRLLLAGVDPSRILCLTFTKAAAAEMAKRVFAALGAWTRLDDGKLAAAIADINGVPPDAAVLARARRLFAAALETPGGLKMQTIHAFCERLLHQFPFEANVPGHFEVLEDRAQAALTVEARKAVLARAAADPDGPLGKALATVLSLTSDFTHEASVAEFVEKRDVIRAWIGQRPLAAALAELRHRLGLGAGETSETARRRIASEARLTRDDAARLVDRLAASGPNDLAAAERLRHYVHATDEDVAALAYLGYFTKEDGGFRSLGSLGTNAVRARFPGLDEVLESEMARLEAAVERLRTAELYESTAAMLTLSVAVIGEYERRKRQRSFLDFEDLVVATVRLLSQTAASRWVQYKLDRGIYHVLVDEAQDTSPRQWQVIRALVDEFFAGESDAGVRTVFAVGDEKQSIFSFQGAVPAWFSRVRREIGRKAEAGGFAWAGRELHLSFRSVPVVLQAVDKVFATHPAHTGLTAEPGPTVHSAFRMKQPGRVVIWPTVKPPPAQETTDWATPLDYLGDQSPEVMLARRIATTIKGWLDRGEALDALDDKGNRRRIRPGEILVLVRTRGALAEAINRQLKSANVPIAGADRLSLTDHIAVMDLTALARVMLTPDDDLSLAALLKSPLIGLDEEALFELAYKREKPLSAVLDDKAAMRKDFAEARARLDAWRKLAETLDPHAFFARVLASDHGRRAFLARLGPEALDVLDEFLSEALRYEEDNAPSLEGFLTWLEESETEIKRDTDAERDEVRVMTVHGAKGLEADVVFLVDNGMAPWLAMYDPRLVPLDDRDDDPDAPGPLVWNRSIKAMPAIVRNRITRAREKDEEEYRRLLYVAMTRARDRLYVVGIDKRTPKDDRRWHTLVRRALDPEATPGSDETGGDQLEWQREERIAATAAAATREPRGELPPWLRAPLAAEAAPLRLTPSTVMAEDDAAAAFVTPRRGSADGRERGRLIHRLLQSLPDLPPAARADAARRYLEAHSVAGHTADEVLVPVLALLDDARFAAVFAPGSRAEVDLAGAIETAGGPATVAGRIDRLAVTPARVLIVDYKTNRPPPARVADVPDAYLRQLALYRLVLSGLYPERIVDAGLLWTETPVLMAIPTATLDAAEMAILSGFRRSPP